MNRATCETSYLRIHPATFPIALAKAVIELFTHRGELVLDPFVGSGTTLVAAQDLERNAVGYDLQPGYVAAAQERLAAAAERRDDTRQLALVADARAIRQQLRPESVALVFTSPPYANLLNRQRKNKSRRGDLRRNDQYLKVEQYSQDPRDLGTLSLDRYTEEIGAIFASLLPYCCAPAAIALSTCPTCGGRTSASPFTSRWSRRCGRWVTSYGTRSSGIGPIS